MQIKSKLKVTSLPVCVCDNYRSMLKALFNIPAFKPVGGKLVSAATLKLFGLRVRVEKSSRSRLLSGVGMVERASHGTVVYVDGSVVSSRHDL